VESARVMTREDSTLFRGRAGGAGRAGHYGCFAGVRGAWGAARAACAWGAGRPGCGWLRDGRGRPAPGSTVRHFAPCRGMSGFRRCGGHVYNGQGAAAHVVPWILPAVRVDAPGLRGACALGAAAMTTLIDHELWKTLRNSHRRRPGHGLGVGRADGDPAAESQFTA
jgi:hypothetical protein